MTRKQADQRPWDEREDLLLRLMLEMGYPAHEIVDAIGRERSAIRAYAQRKGYKARWL